MPSRTRGAGAHGSGWGLKGGGRCWARGSTGGVSSGGGGALAAWRGKGGGVSEGAAAKGDARTSSAGAGVADLSFLLGA